MYTYFLILNDYGFRPSTLWDLSEKKAHLPNLTDKYNPTITKLTDMVGNGGGKSWYGNTNAGNALETCTGTGVDKVCTDNVVKLAWDKTKMSKVDARLFYYNVRNADSWTNCRWNDFKDKTVDGKVIKANSENPYFYKHSYTSEWHPVCYSTEALKYAQSGYLVSIVIVQWAYLMICKNRNLSLSHQGMKNTMGNFGLFFETALVMILCYAPPLNVALGTRAIAFPHFGAPSFSFYCAIFFYDELRKIWLRNGMTREGGKLKLKGWIVQNTYY
jgi:sodium/potassium-transporting ATPase subunit alpha